MTTDIRFCRRNHFTRNSVRHNDQCRKWRVAVGLTRITCQWDTVHSSRCSTSAKNREVYIWEYNKENTGLLGAPYQLAYRLQL